MLPYPPLDAEDPKPTTDAAARIADAIGREYSIREHYDEPVTDAEFAQFIRKQLAAECEAMLRDLPDEDDTAYIREFIQTYIRTHLCGPAK